MCLDEVICKNGHNYGLIDTDDPLLIILELGIIVATVLTASGTCAAFFSFSVRLASWLVIRCHHRKDAAVADGVTRMPAVIVVGAV
jgi:positive regulator of sigma E activity